MGNGASDPHRITESFPDLYADSRGQKELLIENLCTIVQKQINWKLKQQKNSENMKQINMPCNENDISFMINNFFTLGPYRPIKSKQLSSNSVKLNKNWIYATLYIYDIFEEYSPFKMNYLIQNEWINEVFICSSNFTGNDMDLYCCQLIDIMMKCWRQKAFTKYRFNDKNNRQKIYQFVEFKSFYLLNHCLNKKNYLKSFKTTPKNVKIYIYKIIENIQINPIKNRGNIAIKLIQWFMNKRLIKNTNEFYSPTVGSNSGYNNKYKLTYIDILKIIVLRIVILKKKYKTTHSDKIEMAILELNTLLTKMKKLIVDNHLLQKQEFNAIIHNEIMLLIQNQNRKSNTPLTPQQNNNNKKLLSETEVLEFIKIIIQLRPNCLFYFSSYENGCLTPLDLAQKYNLKKLTHFLQIAMNKNKHILQSNNNNNKKNSLNIIVNNQRDSSYNASSENEEEEIIYTTQTHTNNNNSIHNLFKNNNINNKFGEKSPEQMLPQMPQYLTLKPAKTVPSKTIKTLAKHKHSKSDLTINESDFGKIKRQSNKNNNINKKRQAHKHLSPRISNHKNNSKQYIEYLPISPSIRKNAVDYGDSQNIIQPKSEKKIHENPYYIVDDDDITDITESNQNDHIFTMPKRGKDNNIILPKQKSKTQTLNFIANHSSKKVSKQNELESRIEILENENIILKSDIRSLKNLVHNLTNTMQQIIQLQQLQHE